MSIGGDTGGAADDMAAAAIAGQKKAGKKMDKLATQLMDFQTKFFKDVIEPQLTRVREAEDTAIQRNAEVYGLQKSQFLDREATYQDKAKPAIGKYFDEVNNLNADEFSDQQAQAAIGDVRNQQANAGAQLSRGLRARGVNESSPAAIAARSRLGTDASMVAATEAARARRLGQQYVLDAKSKAANFGAGLGVASGDMARGAVPTVGQGAALPIASVGAQTEAQRAQYGAYDTALGAYGQQFSGYTNQATQATGMQNANEQAEAGGWGDLIGTVAGIGAKALFSSDRRLKTDIVQVGRRDDGLNIYSFRYRGGTIKHIGVMADEVKLVYPHAVHTVNGYDAVDYSMLGA